VTEDIREGVNVQLMLMHLGNGMTGEKEFAIPGLPPAEHLVYCIDKKVFENLLHIFFPFFSSSPKRRAEFVCQGGIRTGRARRKSLTKQIRELQREEKKGKSGAKRAAANGQGGRDRREENQGLTATKAPRQSGRAGRRGKGNCSYSCRQLQLVLQPMAAHAVTHGHK
jgi:hypothetical protein